jgi:hypothetical protein
MHSDTNQADTRVVLSDIQEGGVLPGNKNEMWRDLCLLSGAQLRGPAWGNLMKVEGAPVKVEAAVYIKGAINIKAASKEKNNSGMVSFGSSVTSSESVVVDEVPFRVQFLSCLYTGVANLNNCIVYGNVYARRCVLRNSIVLGGIYCQGALQLENSLVSIVQAKRISFGRSVSMFFPLALSEEPIAISYPVRFLPFFDLSGFGKQGSSTMGGAIFADQRDVYTLGANPGVDSSAKFRHALSISERILNISRMLALVRRNQRYLECLSMGRHIDPAIRDAFLSRIDIPLEDRLWNLLNGENVPEIDGYSTVAELAEQPEILDSIRKLVSSEVSDNIRIRYSEN